MSRNGLHALGRIAAIRRRTARSAFAAATARGVRCERAAACASAEAGSAEYARLATPPGDVPSAGVAARRAATASSLAHAAWTLEARARRFANVVAATRAATSEARERLLEAERDAAIEAAYAELDARRRRAAERVRLGRIDDEAALDVWTAIGWDHER
jgi:hypothetical protein